jgi:bacillolysin
MSCRYVVPILSLFVSLFAAPSPFAAKNPNPVSRVPAKERVVYRDVWRTPEIVSGQIATESGRAPLQAAYDFFASRSESYHIDNPESELELIKDRTDQLGFHHLRFQQRFDGLDIWGCQTIVHFSAEGKVYLVAGQSVPTPQISTIPDRSSEEAAQIAADKVRNQLPKGETQTEAELVIYPQNGTTYLCWEVTVTHATRRDIRWKVFVNALTGDVEFFFNDIKSDGPTIGFGKDTRDSIRTIQTYQLYGNYRLLDAARSMYVPPIESRTGIVGTWFHEAGAAFDAVGDPNNNNIFDDNDSVKAAVAGHYYAGQTYEYFKSTFGWNSWDGNGGSISIAVYDPNTMNNAFALGGGFCVFGRGDYTYYLPWSGSLDVVAHEITHNITAVTGGLFYAYQSGALNESYSDFFGAMVDRDDWLIAEEIALWPDGRLRSMSDPADGADPDLYSFGYQPSHMDDFVITDILNDNGGVHINSGIPNHVGYLVANDIGRDKTEQIWWRTLTTYLTPNSHFYFWGEMTIQAAVDLYGEGSPEEASVRAALDVVGIGLLYPEPTVMANIPVLIGEATDTSFIVLNAEVSDTIDLLTITNYSPIVTVTSTIPETLEGRDTVTVDLHIDATALTSCDIGSVLDTIIITTSSDKTPLNGKKRG